MEFDRTEFDYRKLLSGDGSEWDCIDGTSGIFDGKGARWSHYKSRKLTRQGRINIDDSTLVLRRDSDGVKWSGTYKVFIVDFCKHTPQN